MKDKFQLTRYQTDYYTADEPKRIMQPHKHSTMEFCYVIDGELTVEYVSTKTGKSEILSIFPKQFFIIRPYCLHCVHIPHSLQSIGFELSSSNKDFSAQLLTSEYFRSIPLAMETLQRFDDILILNDTQNLHQTILQLRTFTDPNQDMFSNHLYELQLKQLLIEILKCTQESIPTSKQNLYLKKALIFIETNFRKDITAEMLGNYLGISKVYVQKLFRENLKTTVNNEFNKLRIKKAQFLLANSNLSIGEIAKNVGYSSIQTFMTNFKKYTNSTPGEYKKKRAKEYFRFFSPQETFYEEKIASYNSESPLGL